MMVVKKICLSLVLTILFVVKLMPSGFDSTNPSFGHVTGNVIKITGIGDNATTELIYDPCLAAMLVQLDNAEREYYARERLRQAEQAENQASKKAQEELSFGSGLSGLKGAFGRKKSTDKK